MKTSTKSKTPTRPVLERVQVLVLSNQLAYALRLLGRIKRTAELEHWRGIAQINAGQFVEAQHSLTTALALGYRGSISPQAVLHRLTAQNRDWLLQLEARDFEGMDSFDRVLLEREIGILYSEQARYDEARVWLERSWQRAQLGVHGQHQLPGIAESLAHVLGLTGQHAQAVHVLDEALKYANAQRRVPLLLERGFNNLYLQRLNAVRRDLDDVRVFVPNLPTDVGLSARVAFLEAQYQHALGDLNAALEGFKEAEGLALHADQFETEFYAVLWIYTTLLELGRFETVELAPPRFSNGHMEVYEFGADFYGERTLKYATSERHIAWAHLRDALYNLQRHHNESVALGLADAALKIFSHIGAQWEVGAVWLTCAEIALSQRSEFDVKLALREALTVARALGGTVVYTTELRRLPLLKAYLARPELASEFLEFITSSTSYQRLVLYPDGLEINDEPVAISVESVRLLRFLVAHPRSTWAHIKSLVYPRWSDDDARSEFRVATRVCGLLGVDIVLDNSSHAYSAAWSGLTLELVEVSVNLIGPPGQLN